MADDTAALVLSLEARFDKFEKAMADATKVVDRQTKVMEDSFTKLTSVVARQLQSLQGTFVGQIGIFGQLLVALGPAGTAAAVGIGAAVAAIALLTEGAEKAGNKAIEIQNFARATGLSIEEVKAFAAVARQAGVAPEETARSIEILTAAIAQLRDGSGPLVEVLQRYKPELIGILTTTDPLTDRMVAFGQALQTVDTETRNLILRAAGGRAAIDTLGRVFAQPDLATKFADAMGKASAGETDALAKLQLEINATRAARAKMFEEMGPHKTVLENEKRIIEETTAILKAYKEGGVIEAFRELSRQLRIDVGQVEDPKKAAAAQREQADAITETTNTLAGLLDKQSATKEAYDRATQSVGEFAAMSKKSGDSYDEISQNQSRQAKVFARDLEVINGQILTQEKRLSDLGVAQKPTSITVTSPSSSSQIQELLKQQPIVTFLGGAATASEKFTIEQLKLGAAVEKNSRLIPLLARAQAFLAEKTEAAKTATRESLGIATEQEIQSVKLAEANRKLADVNATAAEKQTALWVAAKEASERYEAQLVKASQFPGFTRMALDAQNVSKQFDQLATRSVDAFADALVSAANGSKTLGQAFKDMAVSILNDMAKMIIKAQLMRVLGLLMPGIAPAPSNQLAQRAAGGPVWSGESFLVGERGPELFTPSQAGFITPNSALRDGSGINIGGPVTSINIAGSADRETLLAMQAMLAERDKRFIADVAGATRELRRRSVRA